MKFPIPYYVHVERRFRETAACLITTDSSNMKIEAVCASEKLTKIYNTIYRVSGLEVHKNTCLCFRTQKLCEIYVSNSVQSN